MKKLTNFLAGLLAVGACALMLLLSYEAGTETFAFNAAFFAAMALIVAVALAAGFGRTLRLRNALRDGEEILRKAEADPQAPNPFAGGSKSPFGLEPLDARIREYRAKAEKSGFTADPEDYVNEDVADSYAGMRVLESIPDVLTSLGILGTFIGLIWGMRGFNPVSYEAMAESITSLIDGVKVAFATSIMGISLSLAFTLWLRREQTALSDAFAGFLDAYRLSLSPTAEERTAAAMAENQARQTEATEAMLEKIPESTADAVARKLDVVTAKMNDTLDRFVNVATLNQQEIVDTVAESVTRAMMNSFDEEFREMRQTLDDACSSQREGVKSLAAAHEKYEKSLSAAAKKSLQAAQEDEARRKEASAEFKKQQEAITQFVDSVNSMAERISETSYEDLNSRMAMAKQVEQCQKISDEMEQAVLRMHRETAEFLKASANAKAASVKVEIPEIAELSERVAELTALLEGSGEADRKSLFGRARQK